MMISSSMRCATPQTPQCVSILRLLCLLTARKILGNGSPRRSDTTLQGDIISRRTSACSAFTYLPMLCSGYHSSHSFLFRAVSFGVYVCLQFTGSLNGLWYIMVSTDCVKEASVSGCRYLI